ncbi:MAG: TRAP transporter small permease subunit [Burkholderiaceae bacterium]|nr:TRAP transporter small permease subunit [Burkholderiaceae bacterium]
MKSLLPFAHAIDKLNNFLGKLAVWAVFVSCMVSAGNAMIRYLFDSSSNAWLELQWYLFAVTVMLGTSMVLRVNEHVRVDVLYGRATGTRKAKIDLFGMIVFLMPATLLMVWMSWPWALDSYVHQEMSSNAGGLIRWPIKILVPLGFALLSLQGISEIIKRICFLLGSYQMDLQYERPLQ